MYYVVDVKIATQDGGDVGILQQVRWQVRLRQLFLALDPQEVAGGVVIGGDEAAAGGVVIDKQRVVAGKLRDFVERRDDNILNLQYFRENV